jgi:hypothetical protein
LNYEDKTREARPAKPATKKTGDSDVFLALFVMALFNVAGILSEPSQNVLCITSARRKA